MTLETILLEALSQAPLPLKAADVTKLIKPQAGRAATPKAVAAGLQSLEASGALNLISGGTATKPQPLYTTQSHEMASAAILRQLIHSAKKEQTAAKLKSKLPTALQPHFDESLAKLAAAGEAFVMSGVKRLVFASRPRPSALLDVSKRRALQKMLDVVNTVRPQQATLTDLLIWLDAEATATPTTKQEIMVPDATALRHWYDLDRAYSSTVMIPIALTFARYEDWAKKQGGIADVSTLRNLMTALYDDGIILLEPCERPQDLPELERALLVPMSLGPPGRSWCWIS